MLCCCTLVIAQQSWLRLSEEEVPLVLLVKLCLVKVSADAVSLSSRTPVEWTLPWPPCSCSGRGVVCCGIGFWSKICTAIIFL